MEPAGSASREGRAADAEFAEYVRARQHRLLRVAYLVSGDVHLAEELLRDALVELARRWDRVREEQPDAHVRRILYRDAVSSWRGRHHEVAGSRAHLDVPTGRWDAEDTADDAALRVAVRRALDELTPRQRAVVVLRVAEERSEREAADVLGCSVGTVRGETRDALARLRAALPRLDLGSGGARTTELRELRELLELASEDVPEVDLVPAAWAGAAEHRRSVRRRLVLGAGSAAAAAGVATVVVRRRGGATRAVVRPTPSPSRLRTADVGGATVDLAPEPGEETALPPYRDAAALGLAGRIGFEDALGLPALGPRGGRPGTTASVRAVLLAWSPRAEGLTAVLHLPRAEDGLTYRACTDVPLVRADPTQTGHGLVLHPRTVRDDRRAVVLPQPGEVVVLDARDGTAHRIPVPDPTIHLTGWAKDNRTVVAHGTERTWLVDTRAGTVAPARVPAAAGWVDLVTLDGATGLRSFSAAGVTTGTRPLRGPVIEVDGGTVGNTEGWACAHAYLGQTYVGAVGRSQGLAAVQGDLRPTPRVLAATRSPAVPKGCYRPLVWGPRDVLVLESRSFAGLSSRPTLRLLAWDVIDGALSFVGEVGPVTAVAGGFTGSYAL